MSYSIDLIDEEGKVVSVDNHQSGGVIAVGGSSQATANVTYNYSYFYYNEIDEDEGFRWLDGKEAGETIEVLESAVESLGDEPHRDVDSYWIPCPGNAGKQLKTLFEWAKQHPEAEWRVI